MTLTSLKKWLIPADVRPVPIVRGPFRGAKVCMSLRDNLRKVFGIYEHELNGWLEKVLPRVDAVLDVGANNGYFAFGCAAAFRRMGRPGRIIAFEPEAMFCEQLAATAKLQALNDESVITIKQTLVGGEEKPGQTTLDAVAQRVNGATSPHRTLVKIDVEGAELEVIDGAKLWLNSSNYFLIEVHHESYLSIIQSRFSAAGINLDRVDQAPLPLLGREHRRNMNWWLISPLNPR